MSNVILTVVTTFVLTAAIIWMFQKLKVSERELSTLKKLNEQHLSVEDVQSICSRNLKKYVHTQGAHAPTSNTAKRRPPEKEKREERDTFNDQQEEEVDSTNKASVDSSEKTATVN